MPELLPDVLRHLENLVAFDTRNPPRLIGTGGIFDYIRAQLPGFRCEVVDHGDGAVSLLVATAQALYHYTLIKGRERLACFKAFRLNHWLGLTVWVGVVADLALRG